MPCRCSCSLRDPPRPAASAASCTLAARVRCVELLTNRNYLLLVLYFTLPAIAGWVVRDWMPAILKEQFSLGAGQGGRHRRRSTCRSRPIVGALVGGSLADRWMRRTARGRIYVSAIGMALFLPALFGVGNAGTLGARDRVPACCSASAGDSSTATTCRSSARSRGRELRATGYGIMNFVSISCGGFGDWGFGVLRDRKRAAHAHLRLFRRRGVALADHRPAHPSEPGGALPMTLSRFHGIIVPMVTPLVDRDTLDVAGLERLIEHILARRRSRGIRARHDRRRARPQLPAA